MTPRLLLRLLMLGQLAASACRADDRWVLRYDRPADEWVEALPVGNGRLGAMVFGGAALERLQLNEDSIWTGGPHSYARRSAAQHLGKIRTLLFEGHQAAAEQLAGAKFMSSPLRQAFYQPMADLLIETELPSSSTADNLRRSLVLDFAEANTSFMADGVRYHRRVFVSHPDQALCVHLACDRPKRLSFAARLQTPHDRSTARSTKHGLRLLGQVNDAETTPGVMSPGQVQFVVGVETLDTDGQVTTDGGSLKVNGASHATLVLAAHTNVTSFRELSADPEALVDRDLRALANRSLADLRTRHREDHTAFFDRVELELQNVSSDELGELNTDERLVRSKTTDDPDLAALLFHYGRYLLIASSRPGGQPANLQGLWNQELRPAWGSKYTTNINAEMNYWPAEPCNLSECHEPLFDAIEDLAITGAEVAREHYDCPGWVLHHNFDRWRGAAPINAANHGVWPTGGAWLCQHLWWHYLFSGDERFLRERAYPLMKGAALFFEQYLVEDPRSDDGTLISGPSNSPEHGGLVMGPTMDHQLIRNLFASTAEAARTLGVDSEFANKLDKLRQRIAPNRVGRLGQLQEWLEDVDDPSDRHRHVSHLWGLHPGSEITPSDPRLYAAARRSLDLRGNGATGWARAWKVNLWARLHDGDRAHEVLQGLMTLTGSPHSKHKVGGLYPNLFDAHPPFQIDGNFGATAGICEMLLQSHQRTPDGVRIIELLPALPAAWPAGRAEGLRARGGFAVNLAWSSGQLTSCQLTSDLGKEATVVLGEKHVTCSLSAGETQTFDGGLQPISLTQHLRRQQP